MCVCFDAHFFFGDVNPWRRNLLLKLFECVRFLVFVFLLKVKGNSFKNSLNLEGRVTSYGTDVSD